MRAGGPSIYFDHGLRYELELLHDGCAVGNLRDAAVFKSMLLATQTLPLESSARARTPMPTVEGLHLGRIVGGKPHDGVRLRSWRPRRDSASSMTMSKGDFSPATLTIRPSLILPPGKYSN